MATKGQIKFQIGKNGLSSGTIESLQNAFKTRRQVRISVLKSGTRDRKKIKEMAEELTEKLNGNYKFTIIGFTIIMKRVGIVGKK